MSKIKTLTDKEYNLLDDIATKTHMDCWFCIKQDKNGNEYVFDLENNKRIALSTGVKELIEGIGDINEILSLDEIEILVELLINLI